MSQASQPAIANHRLHKLSLVLIVPIHITVGTRFIASVPAASAPASPSALPFQDEDEEDGDAHKGPHPSATPPASLQIGGQELPFQDEDSDAHKSAGRR